MSTNGTDKIGRATRTERNKDRVGHARRVDSRRDVVHADDVGSTEDGGGDARGRRVKPVECLATRQHAEEGFARRADEHRAIECRKPVETR
jgi:hypothetical protein